MLLLRTENQIIVMLHSATHALLRYTFL